MRLRLWRGAFARWTTEGLHCRKDVGIRSFATFPALKQAGQAEDQSKDKEQGRKEAPHPQRSRLGGLTWAIVAVAGVGLGLGSVGLGNQQYRELRHKLLGPGVSADGFYRYTLIDKEEVSSTSSIFTLRGSGIDTSAPELRRAVVSVEFKQPQLQIARAYTLLPNDDETGNSHDLRFLIRKERNGEMSGYLHRLPVGAEVEVRGPSVDYVLLESVEEVLFLAGGTGIVPAMQLMKTVGPETRMHVAWANRRREECIGGSSDIASSESSTSTFSSLLEYIGLNAQPTNDRRGAVAVQSKSGALVEQLNSIKQRQKLESSDESNVTIDYFVDEEGSFIPPSQLQKLMRRSQIYHDAGQGSRLILVCGPEGFVKYWAGPKQWVQGREVQGPLGGVLSTLDTGGWKVFKL